MSKTTVDSGYERILTFIVYSFHGSNMLGSSAARLLTIGILGVFLIAVFVLSGANAPALHTAPIETVSSDDVTDTDRSSASLFTIPLFDSSRIPPILQSDPADRRSWEVQYMYGVSVVAVLWVAVRALVGWQLNLCTLAVEPRKRPVFTRSRDGPPVSEPSSDDA